MNSHKVRVSLLTLFVFAFGCGDISQPANKAEDRSNAEAGSMPTEQTSVATVGTPNEPRLNSAAAHVGASTTVAGDAGGTRTGRAQAAPIKLNFFDFFPLAPGTKWVYSIQIGDVKPLVYSETSWPESNLAYAVRRHPLALIGSQALGKSFTVELEIAGKAAKQGPFSHPIGRELSIIKDDLGYYGGAKQLFWAATTQERFQVFEVRIFDAQHGPIGVEVTGDGSEQKLLFYCDRQSLSIGLNQNFVEHLIYHHGVDEQVPGYEGIPCVHLHRTLAADQDDNELSKAWTEDTWFAKNKGLVRMVQSIEGTTSMTWTLTEFTPPGDIGVNAE